MRTPGYISSGHVGICHQARPKQNTCPVPWSGFGIAHGGKNHSWTNPPREAFEDPTQKQLRGGAPKLNLPILKRNRSTVYVYIYICICICIYIYARVTIIHATVQLTTLANSESKLQHHLVVGLIAVMPSFDCMIISFHVFNVFFVESPQ